MGRNIRFVAYWDRGKQHANIPIDDFVIEDSIIKLMKKGDGYPVVMGYFDMGFLDAWYVTEGRQ